MISEMVVATRNRGKLQEIRALLDGVVERVLCLDDFPGIPTVVEDGATFAENAVKKAREVVLAVGKPVMADDSGLVVEALGGRPGVFSARFAGERATDGENNEKLLQEMAGIPDDRRRAAFHCVIAICFPDGACHTFDGEVDGVILRAPRGDEGFGYDPLFFFPEFGQTFAELPFALKNSLSHRGKALDKLKEFLLTSQAP